MYSIGGTKMNQQIDSNLKGKNKDHSPKPVRRTNSFIKPTWLYEEARRRYEELKPIRDQKEEALAKTPEGSVHVVRIGKGTQYYFRSGPSDKKGKYIPKHEAGRIKTYLQKAYDKKVLKLLNAEINSLEKHLIKSDQINKKIRDLYSKNPDEVKNFLNPVDLSDEDFRKQWESIPFKGKEISDYMPFYETRKKERVRSKSELNIANLLDAFNVPYKYERPLKLSNGVVIHPDFTLLDVKRRKEIYWEHRGMMDDREYAKQAVLRVKTLLKEGICLGDNLIITEETTANPLGTDEIEAVIKEITKSPE